MVGTHGHTGIHRFLLGSVATAVLRHAPCDVLVCRGQSGPTPFSRPLVATDFSPAAARALRNAAMLTAPGAPIEIIHAWQLPAGSWGATILGQARFPWSTVRDAVLTSGGMVGTIVSIGDDDTVVLRVKPDNVKILVVRSAVASLLSNDGPGRTKCASTRLLVAAGTFDGAT